MGAVEDRSLPAGNVISCGGRGSAANVGGRDLIVDSAPILAWRCNLMQGATHGLAHTLTQLGYLRPHNLHPHYHNLYFVGASTHPGTGVPTALVCARQVAERIADDWRAGRSPHRPAS